MNTSPTVTVTNLNHSFGQGTLQKPVLTNIDLAIYPGEIVILTGPSGSGKTTLLSLIGGLRSVQEGSLKIFNQELKGCNKKQLTRVRNQIGFIFQHHNLLKCLTAYGNVRMSLKLHSEIPKNEYRQRAINILNAVGLGDRVDYYPEKLSGGQKQRVAIARALVAQPKLVLADEPTSSLDSKTGRDVVDIIQRLAKEEHCSVLIVTHDARILDIGDRIVHMEDGRLQDG
ncbi:ABC exporter ATP-binding subunit, DevA family [Nostoc sp. PCC 7524]|jgi:putative ABC transport system ATP-binding protein|uniref:DevA family ABC transporter ATP-binding protein n=1 Tax=Nostoc sp. (strain ATCC 29411 / PCC 7524) TaxID=28072 RepID=UPI00029F1EE0|nr:DevA family ABC transporter ATP-binding protein [Nostoc sp. PCC 7524]AFY46541.1 ABC exporter ATP-binding subunit, DevA family [Nostoc sp. PCC 7524]